MSAPTMIAPALTKDYRRVLGMFATGRSAEFIAAALPLDRTVVDAAIALADSDPERAQRLTDAYDRRPSLVAAAKGAAAPAPTAPVVPAPAFTAPGPAQPVTPAAGQRVDEPDTAASAAGLEKLLAQAEVSPQARTRALGVRVAQLVTELRTRLAAEAAETAARARVDALRRELAAAEELLRQTRRGDVAPAGPDVSATPAASDDAARVDPREVRAWAQANGVECSTTGRVAATVVQQWRAATGRAA